MAQRKKMLFLCGLFPLPVSCGTQLRTLHLLQRLSQRFDITLITHAAAPGWTEHVDELKQYCTKVMPIVPSNKLSVLHRFSYKVVYWVRRILLADSSDRFYNSVPNVNRAIRRELAAGPYDVIFAQYWFWDAKIFEAPGLKVIDANDVQSQRVERLLERSRNPIERALKPYLVSRYRKREAQALNRADVVLATTVKDRAVFETMTRAATQNVVLPTGIDTDYFLPQAKAPDPKNIVFYGALANPMNRDAVRYLVRDIMPRIRERVPGARLTLVGSSPSAEILALAERDPSITVTGYVEDVRRPLAEAGVVVCPLRFGYGIRGRIFELLSMSIPVVATTVAVDGMELVSGDGLLLADNPAEFAAAVASVLEDPTLRGDLARRGREIAVGRMSIAVTYDRLAEILDERTQLEPVPAPS